MTKIEIEGLARVSRTDSDGRSQEVHDEIVEIEPGDTIHTDGLCELTIVED